MKQFRVLATAFAAALLVAACGGGGDGDQSPAVKYASVVSFGDSLSDAGTYSVGPIKASGGGMFTVNGIASASAVGADPVPSYNWAQLVSAAAIGKTSCAARTGGFGVVESVVAGCTNYAQGGARVVDPKGVGNPVGVGFTAGPLTEPVVTQIANYLADGGSFAGTELVTVLGGANDLFGQTDKLKADATAAGGAALATSLVTQLVAGAPPANQLAAQAFIGGAIQTEAVKTTATPTSIITAAVTAAATHAAMNGYTNTAVANAATIAQTAGAAAIAAGNTYLATTGAANAMTGMAVAATALANSVKSMITSGAKHVVVVNIPDVSQTPMAMATIVYNTDGSIKDNSQQQLVLALTSQFNTTLQTALEVSPGVAVPGVVFVDAFAENRRQLANKAHYALTNVKDVACNLTSPVNVLATAGKADGSSLVCNAGNLIAGDTSHYLFADNVHPTPYGHKLLAQYVTKALVIAGWL
ncbi:SGNH/GDSL hydrolase family protein [Rhodoferax ferrireducens]|uniref:SGNH/GDSL hydrolase family protein n=1 Tax=Rhodoferax ferrireducens TaxID=192843 RepID=UPI003BB5B520